MTVAKTPLWGPSRYLLFLKPNAKVLMSLSRAILSFRVFFSSSQVFKTPPPPFIRGFRIFVIVASLVVGLGHYLAFFI